MHFPAILHNAPFDGVMLISPSVPWQNCCGELIAMGIKDLAQVADGLADTICTCRDRKANIKMGNLSKFRAT